MDPLANLLEQLDLAAQLESCTADDCDKCSRDGRRLAELVQALDGWLRGGGFLPTRWQRREGGA